MAPKSSQQPSMSKPTKKAKVTTTKLNTLKLTSVATSPSPPVKRFDPLTAFVKPFLPSSSRNDTLSEESKGKGKAMPKINPADDRLWVERYEPTTEAELAVHSKKVEDVRRWLVEAFEGGPSGKLRKYRRILVLTGPAGTAKTATIRVLANEMGLEIVEWRNAIGEEFSHNTNDFSPQYRAYDHEALFTKFESFLARASTCQNIFGTPASSMKLSSNLLSSSQSRPRSSQPQSSQSSSSQPSSSQARKDINRLLPKRRLILLEDLPNILHEQTQVQFHAALESLVLAPLSNDSVPIIIIVSDAGIRGEAVDERTSEGNWSRDKGGVVDIRTVLSKNLLHGPYVTQIGFNPIAPTLMRRALQALLATHFPPSSKVPVPSKQVLDAVVESSNGDIRSAIMALQFACVIDLPGAKRGKGKKGAEKADTTKVVLESITRREQSLALFHLIGKVLYNKRKGDPPNSSASAKDVQKEKDLDSGIKDSIPHPPFLTEHNRRASRVDVDTLYADTPIDSSLFSLYIHQNYTQFCNEMDECGDLVDWLSWVDSSGGEAWYQANPHRFHLLTLGTLHSLPSPVVRRSQKFFKPDFFSVLTKEKDAWAAVRDARDWLTDEGVAAASSDEAGWRAGGWSLTDVAMELGGVLRAREASGGRVPRAHQTFSRLAFRLGDGAGAGMDQLAEGELPVDAAAGWDDDETRWRGRMEERTDIGGGWLESDDIEEF